MSRARWSHGHGSDMPVTQGHVPVPVPAGRCRRWCLRRSCPPGGLSGLVKISGAHSAVSLKIIQRAGGRHNGGRRWGQAPSGGVRGLGSLREPGEPVPVVFGVPRAQRGLGVLGVRRAGGVAVLHSGAGVFCPPGARVWSITALHLLGGYPWGLQVLQAALISQMGEASEHPRGSPCKSLPPNRAARGWGVAGEGLCWGEATREPLAGGLRCWAPAPGGMGPPGTPPGATGRTQGTGGAGSRAEPLAAKGPAQHRRRQTKAFCALSLCASPSSPPRLVFVSSLIHHPSARCCPPSGGRCRLNFNTPGAEPGGCSSLGTAA